MNRKVLISGATGYTGRAAVREALKLGLDVRALVRSIDSRSDALAKQGAEVAMGDLQDLDSVRAAMENIDAAYFVYPVAPGLVSATAYFAQAAREAEVQAIVNLSQRSASRTSLSHSSKDHFVAEQLLSHSGLNVVHLRPTFFLEWLLYPFQLPLIRKGILRLPVGRGRHAPIAADDQGRVIAAVLSKPDAHFGKTYALLGPVEMDHEQMAAELTTALGYQVNFEDMPIESFREMLVKVGVTPFRVSHLVASMGDYQRGVMSGTSDDVERLTGTKPMTVGDFARLHVAEFERDPAAPTVNRIIK